MKLMTIWRAYHRATNSMVDIILDDIDDIERYRLRQRQAIRFGDAIEQHLQEWDDDIEELNRLVDEVNNDS